MSGAEASTERRERPFRLGPFHVDPQRNRIARGADETLVQPKVMDLLCVLAERPGEVVGRNALIDLVWGRAFGADESLTKAISQLRKAFGGGERSADVIETIPKRGYRLLIAPTPIDSPDPGAGAAMSRPRGLRGVIAGILLLGIVAAGLAWFLQSGGAEPVRSERTCIVVTV